MAKKKRSLISKYEDEYPQMLIEHMAKGYSFESFAGEVGVCVSTLRTWAKEHPEFKGAKEIAFEKCRLKWESIGIDHILNLNKKGVSKSLNSSVWIFNMKNRFPKEWKEKRPGEEDQVNINISLADKLAKARARANKKDS